MILNKTTKSSDRYQIIAGSQGNYGEPKGSPNHNFVVVRGVDRGNGYQSYLAVSYAFDKRAHLPPEARRNLIEFLREHGYSAWLKSEGLLK